MKKLLNSGAWDYHALKKCLITMKIFLFVMILSMGQLLAIESYSQKTKLSLDFTRSRLVQVLDEIENQTDFYFLFNEKLIDMNKEINIHAKDQKINEILESLFKDTNIEYQIIDRKIVLSPKDSYQSQQKVTVSGKVQDTEKQPLPGVSVVVKGTTQGIITNTDGSYSLVNVPSNAILVYSFVGMKTQEINVENQSVINVFMEEETIGVEEVVVTALGIAREKKGLGYAVQEIKGEELNVARETNFVNSLAGKVAGVNIVSGSAIGSSSRITMRGESSLSLQSNQPLFVIDGIPVGNDKTTNTTLADYGNSSAEINPTDIESMTVLKGPAASALYGSRAANGVIVIVTKSGKLGKGIGVSVNSGTTFETLLRLPKFQNKFGQGNNGQYEGSNFGASWSIYPNGVWDNYDESWGPRLDVGTIERQYFSPTTGGMRGGDVANPNRGEVIATPWISRPNNIKDFFEVGHTVYNNVAITGSNDKGAFRASYTNLNEKGVIPNNNITRNTISFKASYNFTDKFKADITTNYIKTTSPNRPDNGYDRSAFMYFTTWFVRNGDMNSLKDYWQTGLKGVTQYQYNYGENHNNPFFLQYENTKGQDKDRLFGSISLNYDITDKLSFLGRAGTDMYNDFRPMKWAVGTVGVEKGKYEEEFIYFSEQNYDFLLSYKDHIGEDFNFNLSVGGNRMDRDTRYRSVTAPTLLIPGLYTISNSASALQVGSSSSVKRINSLYAFTRFDYKSMLYLDMTFRNDWSSTLPLKNNSYFYPSVSFSALVDQLVKLPDWVMQAKIRMGVAGVGNDTSPYSLRNTYNFVNPTWGNNFSLATGGALPNADLKPEQVSTYEIGTEIKLFKNRLGFDFTYYDIRAKNQIIGLPLTSSTSYGSRIINAGEVQNKGFEIMMNILPVKTTNFTWDVTLNFSTNEGRVLELAPGVDRIIQATEAEDAATEAVVGQKMGALYGPGYQRVENGPMKGEIIIGSNGAPLITSEYIHLGNANPDWIGSVANGFFYKNFNLNVLVDIHYGGQFISRFYNKANGAGQLKDSELGRAARPVGHEYDSPYYIAGAALVDGEYVPNNTSTDGTFSEGVYGTSARYFIKKVTDHITEGQVFDATYMKLREVRFGYAIPNKLFKNALKDVTISLVGRNLLLWTPKSNQHFDPEASVATRSDGVIQGQEDMSLPSTRSYGFNLSLKF